jgi:hypothetical protein
MVAQIDCTLQRGTEGSAQRRKVHEAQEEGVERERMRV